jgi:hypothetical protein
MATLKGVASVVKKMIFFLKKAKIFIITNILHHLPYKSFLFLHFTELRQKPNHFLKSFLKIYIIQKRT